ncbi:asparagine synthase (glutamine-hydrolyzing) [Megalodesulfovibrio paquesii]
MCGFVACYAWDTPSQHAAPWPEILLRHMNSLQASRGPDHAGLRLLLDGRLALAHTRLAILDLDPRANQPMANAESPAAEAGRHQLVFNGEIYNHAALRRELETAGARFHTTSDTEVLLQALMHWGEAALPRLEGMFSFVYVDLMAGVLLAARDRLGIKPLAWTRLPGGIAFASTITPLTLLPGFDPAIDPLARLELLATKCVPAPRSIYANIRKLPPGHCLRVRFDGHLQERAWWGMPQWADWLEARPGKLRGYDVLEHELEAALAQSVARQLEADVPVGVFLSGGLDSSLVTALAVQHARQQGGGRIQTFCMGFAQAGADAMSEAPYARAIAGHLGTDHHERIVTPADLLEVFPTLAEVYDEPFGDASAAAMLLLCRFARQHVTVALSGDGGDEQFFGYTRYHHLTRLLPVLQHLPARARRLARLTRPGPPRGPRTRMDNWRLGLLGYHELPTLYIQYVYDWYAHLAAYAGAGTVAQFHALSRAMETAQQAMRLAHGDVRRAMMLADLLHYLPEDCLTKVDRASMACALEVRPPLLDELTVRHALPMPVSVHWQGGKGKAVLRRILARHVPRHLFERPKAGFAVPLKHWLFGPLREQTESLLDGTSCLAMGLDPSAIARVAREHREGRQDHQHFLWSCCCLSAWTKREARRRVECSKK